MKIIITESQYILLRRLEMFIPALYEVFDFTDPCEYSRYEQYKRTVVTQTLGYVISRERLHDSFSSVREMDDFRDNVLGPFLEDTIREHYDYYEDIC